MTKKANNNPEEVVTDDKLTIAYDSEELRAMITHWLNHNSKRVVDFSEVLSQIGFSNTDRVVLYDMDNKNLKFKFTYMNRQTPKDSQMELFYGDQEDYPAIIVSDAENKRYYEYRGCAEDAYVPDLVMCYYTLIEDAQDVTSSIPQQKVNKTNGHTYTRYLTPNNVRVCVTNSEYEMCLSIYREKQLKDIHQQRAHELMMGIDVYSDQPFRLANENLLEDYLLNLELPWVIDEVYKKICALTMPKGNRNYLFNLEIRKKNDMGSKVTDELIFNNGRLSKATITKNGRTVSWDENFNWSYQNEQFSYTRDPQTFEYLYQRTMKDGIPPRDLNVEADLAKAYQEVGEAQRLIKEL